MSGWTKAYDAITGELVGKTGVRVLVVEGDDDRSFFEAMLDLRSPGWESDWVTGSANGKGNVARILEAEPTWIGIVDRDEWSTVAAQQAAADSGGRLFVLPRFCMESYFVVPDELWSALPVVQQQKITGGKTSFDTAVSSDIDLWLRHGALWHAVNPLWNGLRAKGFQDALLDLQAAQDDAVIQQKLQDWHDHLEPTQIFAEFNDFHAAASGEPLPIQLNEWIHGKRRFTEHTVPNLNSLLGQKSASQWLEDLRKTLPLAPDLDFVWQAMGL